MLDKTDFVKLKNNQEVLAGHRANLLFSDFKNRKISSSFRGDFAVEFRFRVGKDHVLLSNQSHSRSKYFMHSGGVFTFRKGGD